MSDAELFFVIVVGCFLLWALYQGFVVTEKDVQAYKKGEELPSVVRMRAQHQEQEERAEIKRLKEELSQARADYAAAKEELRLMQMLMGRAMGAVDIEYAADVMARVGTELAALYELTGATDLRQLLRWSEKRSPDQIFDAIDKHGPRYTTLAEQTEIADMLMGSDWKRR